jgi:hypothetical protein
LPDLSAKAWPLSWGSFPFGASGRPEPTNPGLASPGTLRLQTFTASWRLASPDAFRPYFMPVTPLGFALQSFFPSSSRVPLGSALPSCRSPSRFGSASGPCSRAWVRCSDGSFSDSARARCSPGLSSPPGFSPLSRWLPFRFASSLGLLPAVLADLSAAVATGASFGVFRAGEVALNSLEFRRPSWGFLPRRLRSR